MAFDWTVFFTLLIAAGLFYLASAIMCASMFGRKVKKWSWLNLLMAAACSLIWVFGLNIPGIGNAGQVTFGIILFLVCYFIWTLGADISERRAVWATAATLVIWFALCWLLIIILHLFEINTFDDLPTLFTFFT